MLTWKNKLLQENKNFNFNLNALRAYAILLIVLLHLFVHTKPHPFANFLGTHFNLAFGVEILFVIAGYLLSLRLLRGREEGRTVTGYEVVFFIKRRLNRLLPVVFVWCLIPLILSCLHVHPAWLTPGEMWRKFISGITMLRNFEEMGKPTGFGYFWAVSLEFQFFLVFTLLFYYLNSKLLLYLSAILLGILALYRSEIFFGGHSWMFRFDGLLWGYILAYIQVKTPGSFQAVSDCIQSLGRWKAILFFFLLLLASLSIHTYFINDYSLRFAIQAMMAFLLVFWCVASPYSLELPVKPMEYVILFVGIYSYSIFATHIPALLITISILNLEIIKNFFSVSPMILFFLSLLLTLIFSVLTYKFVEKKRWF